jgi:hypothetical protein
MFGLVRLDGELPRRIARRDLSPTRGKANFQVRLRGR